MSTRCRSIPVALALALSLSACDESVLDSNEGPWVGDWVQVNFLSTDDRGVWDADDLTGIGFTQSITETEWVLTDDYGGGCAITFSYSVNSSNKFSRRAIRAGSRCPPGLPISLMNGSGRFELTAGGRFLIEHYDLKPGDEIAAFKFVRR